MSFPNSVADSVFVKCKRSCCICHKFCGTKMELHHIKQASLGGPDTEENCIPLCFDCHADVKAYNPKHPKGHSYSEQELIKHRENWYNKVKNSNSYGTDEEFREVDKKTYAKIKEFFNENMQYFLSRFNFADNYFTDEVLDPLYKLNELCCDPEYEFLDSDLEMLKLNLNETVVEFVHNLAINTFPCGSKMFSVPSEWVDEQPERFEQVVKLLNDNASRVWEKYVDFIKVAKRKLLV